MSDLNIRKLRFQVGTTFTPMSGVHKPGLSVLDVVDDAIQALGYISPLSCCYTGVAPTNGSILSWSSTLNKFVFTTAGTGTTNLGGIPTPTGIGITSSSGTGYVMPLATSINAGLLSPSQFTALNSLTTSGLASTESITGNGLVASPFKLVNDTLAPGNNYYYGTNATGVKGWYLSNVSTGVTNLSTTTTPTNVTINSDTGTGAIISLADSTNSGLLSPTDFTKLSNLSGTNTGDVTVTDSSSIDFTLTGQNITAAIIGLSGATAGQIPSSDGAGNLTWITPSSSVTNLIYAASATNGVVQSDTGTDATIPLVNSLNAGLMSPSDKTKSDFITATTPVNLNTLQANSHVPVTVTDSGSIDFTLTGQDVTGVITGISTATVGQLPSKGAGDTIVWTNGLTLADVSTSYKYYQLTPTGVNTIPNLTFLPIEPTEVTILVNGLKESAITVDSAGVFTIDNVALGYNIDHTDIITVTYFSL